MDGLRFDLWTRRRFGLAAGGLAALLVFPIDGAAKKKKKKKKRCLNIGADCVAGSKKRCCKNLRCDFAGGSQTTTFCCKTAGECRFGFDCCFGWVCEEKECVQITSDRALKTNFATVDSADMLRRVRP